VLDAGDPAPDFLLPAVDDPTAEYMLSTAATAAPVVLAFVARPDDPLLDAVATVDWTGVADRVVVLGVASEADGPAADHPFPVLVDADGYVTDRYGVPRSDDGRAVGALAVVDGRCRLRFAWTAPTSDATPPVDSLRAAVADAS
jgi:peroxiredoxin